MIDRKTVTDFLADDRGGERDTLTTLLLLALIVLPLVALVVFFGDEIKMQVENVWGDVFGSGIDLSR